MNMTNLYAVLICLIPVLLAVIMAKRYNFIHGLISFVFFSFVLHCCLYKFGSKLPADVFAAVTHFFGNGETITIFGSQNMISFFNDTLKEIPFLTEVLSGKNMKWVLIGIYLGVFVICQIFASIIRGARVRKIKRLKSQAKRY